MRISMTLSLFLYGCTMLVAPVLGAAQATDPTEFFETRIRPVLANNCFACHTSSKLGGLELDSRENMLKGGKSGPVIMPGKPEESLLIRAVRQEDERLKMPLGGKLKEQEVLDLTSWVRMGAPWPESIQIAQPAAKGKGFTITAEQRSFWSFQPIGKPALPEVKEQGWAKSPIDHFVLSRLEAQGLKPVRAADKRTLLRRASFDLTGLPPTPEEVEAFLRDDSPEAFARVVDRLLASPHYGERWGRYWLDVARYAEDDMRAAVPAGREMYPNAWRYRDWAVQAFNQDMPYDLFVKAQIAGDLLGEKDPEKLSAGTGFFGLGPWYYDTDAPPPARANERHDRVDALTRGFLGLTVACARCHDHKYDPISMKDYYALAGVFAGTEYAEYPLAPENLVAEFKSRQRKVKDKEAALKEFTEARSTQLAEILARRTSQYMTAAWKVLELNPESRRKQGLAPSATSLDRMGITVAGLVKQSGPPEASKSRSASESSSGTNSILQAVAEQEALDSETLERWVQYLGRPQKDHPFLKAWDDLLARGGTIEEVRKVADEFQGMVLAVIAEKKEIDEENRPIVLQETLSKKKVGDVLLPNSFVNVEDYLPLGTVSGKSIERDKFVLWSDLFVEQAPERGSSEDASKKMDGVLLYKDEKLGRFLDGEWKEHLESMRAEVETLKKALPPQYAYLHGICEARKPGNLKMHLRGNPYNLGEEVPRRFLAILSQGEPAPFTQGSGRLQLAEAIASHPLAARVMVNRIWRYHFGRGIVGTPSNFGQLGERPSHPELLEYLADRFIANHYSVKALHREIMLSATYKLSSDFSEQNFGADPDNRLYWRANHRRLDVEALRDSLLFVSGGLDNTIGGPSAELTDDYKGRTIYASISRFKLNSTLTTFDFPDASITSEQRIITHVPLQRLFFLNSSLVWRQAGLLANRLSAEGNTDDVAKIKRAYQMLYGRETTDSEVQLGLGFLQEVRTDPAQHPTAWQQYAQVLLSSNEFLFVD